jgi:hypothetical protein
MLAANAIQMKFSTLFVQLHLSQKVAHSCVMAISMAAAPAFFGNVITSTPPAQF